MNSLWKEDYRYAQELFIFQFETFLGDSLIFPSLGYYLWSSLDSDLRFNRVPGLFFLSFTRFNLSDAVFINWTRDTTDIDIFDLILRSARRLFPIFFFWCYRRRQAGS